MPWWKPILTLKRNKHQHENYASNRRNSDLKNENEGLENKIKLRVFVQLTTLYIRTAMTIVQTGPTQR